MNKRLSEAIDHAIQEILNENPTTLRDQNGKTVITCGDGPAVAFKVRDDHGTVHIDFNDRRTGGAAWHDGIKTRSPGDEVLRGRFWNRNKVASFYEPETVVEPYKKHIEKFFSDLGEDINSYTWDFNDSSEDTGLTQWKSSNAYNAPKIKIPPEIQKKITALLPQFHVLPDGPERKKIKQELDALYKEAGIENEREAEDLAFKQAAGEKKVPFEKGGGAGLASYRGRLPAREGTLAENPDTMRDDSTGQQLTVYDGPAISFFCIVDESAGKHKWFYYRNDHGAAWHQDIRKKATPEFPDPWAGSDRYLRGRMWTDHRVCSFYYNETQFGPTEFKLVEELFQIVGEDIEQYKFEFNNSARDKGLIKWIGQSVPEKKPELSPEEQQKVDEIEKQIAELQATLHLYVGDEKVKVEKQIEKLEKQIGKIGGIAAQKAAYRATGDQKKTPYELGGGGTFAAYKGRLPAIAEAPVRLYNKTLCPKVWTAEKKLLPDVRQSLLHIALDFYTDTELEGTIQDVQLLGSVANYNWTPKSDMDVHILVDGSKVSMQPEEVEKYFRSMVGKWNLEHDITVKGHPVELYLQDIHEKNAATGVYSLVHDQWVKDPSPEKVMVDRDAIQKKYSMWVEKINDAIKDNDEKKLKKIVEGLREYRQAGLDENGEFSTENIVFKILRARGFLDKLKELRTSIYDKKMTVKDGFEPTSMGPNPEAGQTEDSNGQFYQRTNDRMRQMEGVGMKDLKAVHPKHAVMHDNPEFERLTIDNLKALRDKSMRFYAAAKSANDKGEMERAKAVYQMFHNELKKRLEYINKPMSEGYGAGIPETDRLKVPNDDGSVRRWQIRSKDAPKTPKIPDSVNELINEVLNKTFLGTK